MRRSLIVAGFSALVLSGCGNDEPAQGGGPDGSSPAGDESSYVESAACRADARRALGLVERALGDTDVQAVEERVRTLGQMTPAAFAQCTDDVAEPAMESIDALGTALDATATGTGADIGQELARAKDRLGSARAALDATG